MPTLNMTSMTDHFSLPRRLPTAFTHTYGSRAALSIGVSQATFSTLDAEG